MSTAKTNEKDLPMIKKYFKYYVENKKKIW